LASGHNTRSVVLPWFSINTDGKRRNSGSGGFHVFFIFIFGGILVSSNFGIDTSGFEGTGLVAGVVGIALFGIQTSGFFDVFVGSGGVTSVTTTIRSVAVDDLLRREGSHLSRGDSFGNHPNRFNVLSDGKSPAASALSLILDGCNFPLALPVKLGRSNPSGEIQNLSIFRSNPSDQGIQIFDLKFGGSQIREFSQIEGSTPIDLGLLVEFLDFFQIGVEDGETGGVLLGGPIVDIVFGEPTLEEGFIVLTEGVDLGTEDGGQKKGNYSRQGSRTVRKLLGFFRH